MVPPAWRRTPGPTPRADSDTFSVTATKRVGSGTALDCSKSVVAVELPGVPTIGTVTVAPRQLRASHLHQPESIPTSDVIRLQGTVGVGEGEGPVGLAGKHECSSTIAHIDVSLGQPVPAAITCEPG
jgi:hypothetical protein